jgi:hypothetical protein
MLVADIISTADARTEKRGGQALNLDNELLLIVQEFCQVFPWPWRLKTVPLSTVAGIAEYALPLDGENGPCEVDDVYSVQIVGGATDIIGLDPVNEPADQARRQNTDASGQPTNYFRKLGDPTKLRLSPIPDNVYPLVLCYWAVPGAALGTNLPTYIQPKLHGILIKGLEATILRYTLGTEDEKYQTTKSEYDTMIQKAWQG